ncbi:MAG: ATP synthase F1 subunit delta [Gemmataceae bacterium]
MELKQKVRELIEDVSAQRIAAVYAQALHDAAAAENQADDVYEELRSLVQDVYPRDVDFERFLASAAIGRAHKEALIDKVFKDRASPLFVKLLHVLNNHGRLELVRVILKEYRELRDRLARRVRVHISSAVPLADAQRDGIAAEVRRVLQLEPIVETSVDPHLLGGVVLRVEDWLYDGSLRTRLEKIRKNLMESCSHEIQSGRDRFRSD